ncbi:MAG: GNAT family N-acetyltransferase [Ruminococcaceae bacterium]|nr:GNAT family N-acetyltransferase [Oscillospiraceae bacterium]
MNKLTHLTNSSAPELPKLFAKEKITYSVLEKILNLTCTDIFTDNENFIICYSAPPYPVWVWQKDNEDCGTAATVADILNRSFSVLDGYKYNMSYELFRALSAVNESFAENRIAMGMLSYELIGEPVMPNIADGAMESADISDIEVLTDMLLAMSCEAEGLSHRREEKKQRIIEMIDSDSLYVWRAQDGRIAATASVGRTGDCCRIGSVYTRPDMRRRGYAISLIYYVSAMIKNADLRPILYTDESYAASNACYKKIGFCEIGRLCNVSGGKD